MPLLTAEDVHVDAIITNMSAAYMQDPSRFIWRKIAPLVPVDKRSNKYFIWPAGNWRRSEMQKRAEGTFGALATPTLSTDSYFCERYSLGFPATEELMANYDIPLDIARVAALYLAEQANIKLDQLAAAALLADSIWTGSTTGTAITVNPKWDAASATPVADVAAESDAVLLNIGRRPNILVLGVSAYRALQQSADILDRIRYTGTGETRVAGLVTLRVLAEVFGVNEVIIAESSVNVAHEGAADDFDFIVNPNDAFLLYVNPVPSLMSASSAYTYMWQGLIGSANGLRVKNIPVPLRSADIIEADFASVVKVVSANSGVQFDNVLT